MKKYSFIFLLSIIAGTIQAQIPNSGFESWTSMGSYEIPDLWGNMNTVTSPSGVYTTIKGSPGATGNSYIKLTTKDVGGIITPGMIVSGALNAKTWQAVSGFPFNQRVESLIGKYQFMGYNDDVATIAAWLTKWNAALHRRDTIASLVRNTSGMIHVWTGFSIPFLYQSTDAPDTAIVFISSSSHAPRKNSFIWLDDLNFDGVATALPEVIVPGGISVYYAPASGQVNLEFYSKIGFSSQLSVFNIAGDLIFQSAVDVVAGSNRLNANLGKSDPMPGVYLIQLSTASGPLTRKFVIGR